MIENEWRWNVMQNTFGTSTTRRVELMTRTERRQEVQRMVKAGIAWKIRKEEQREAKNTKRRKPAAPVTGTQNSDGHSAKNSALTAEVFRMLIAIDKMDRFPKESFDITDKREERKGKNKKLKLTAKDEMARALINADPKKRRFANRGVRKLTSDELDAIVIDL